MDQNSKEKKLFFFGQPGCLKVKFDIPIRPSDNSDSQSDDNDNEKNNSQGTSDNTLIDDKNTTTKKAENSSDEDGEELLKKIDAALEVKNEHQSEENSETLSSQTIKKIPIIDASNNHVEEVSTETIQKESNSIEIQSFESSTNEESQNKCEEKSALEKASSANTETITEKIENVYNVKSVDNNIEVNDENSLVAIHECKPIELKSEEISSKSLELMDEKSEESDNAVENLIEPSQNVDTICESEEIVEKMKNVAPNESSFEEKNLEKEEVSLKEVENVEIESRSEIPVDEKSHKEIDENKEKEIHSENLASELLDNQTEICESSVNNEAIDPVIFKIDQNDAKPKSVKNTSSDDQASSALITEDIQIYHSKTQDTTDNANVITLPDLQGNVSSENLKSEIIFSESIHETNEKLAICESDSTTLHEEIKSNQVPNDDNTCLLQESQVLTNETSIKNYEESGPKNDNLELKNENIEAKEKTLQHDDKNIKTRQEKQLKMTDVVENVESQTQETEPSHEELINENIASIETQIDESLIETENTQSKEEKYMQKDQTEKNLCTEIEIIESTQVSNLEKEATECKDEFESVKVIPGFESSEINNTEVKCSDNQALISEMPPKNVDDDQVSTPDLVEKQKGEFKDDVNTESVEEINPCLEAGDMNITQIVPDQEINQQTELQSGNLALVGKSSQTLSDTKEFKTIESRTEDIKADEPNNIESTDIEPCSNLISQNVEDTVENTMNEKSYFVEQNLKEEPVSESKEQSQPEDQKLEKHREISTEPEEPLTKKEIVEVCALQEQNTCILMESQECEEKEEISENIEEQNINENSVDQLSVKIESAIENIQKPVSMEIEDVEETEFNLPVELKTKISIQYESTSKKDPIFVQPTEEYESSDKEEVMEINDQNIAEQPENITESIPTNSSDLSSKGVRENENLEIEQIKPIAEIIIQKENKPIEECKTIETHEGKESKTQYEEVQQNVVTLESNKKIDSSFATETSNYDANVENIEDAKATEMPNVESENQKSQEVEMLSQNQNNEIEQVDIEEKVLEQHQKSEISDNLNLSEATTSIVEEKFICESKEIILKVNEIYEPQFINEDQKSLNQEKEIIPDTNELEVFQFDENPKLESNQGNRNLENEKEIDIPEKIEEKVESQYIEKNIQYQNQDWKPQPPNEKLNEIDCSYSVENKETVQKASDKPEVLREMPKESCEDKTKEMTIETQPEFKKEHEFLNQNIEKVELSPSYRDSEDIQTLEIDISDEKDPKEFVDFKENQESKNKNECKEELLSSGSSIDAESNLKDEIEVIPQKSITVEENSNEKINDNQVELSKNDNKSSSFEKVSPLEVINIQNEISEDLTKSNTTLIDEESKLDESSSVAQIDKDIQLPLSENFDDQNIEEKKVKLKTEKQYELITGRHTEDNLTDEKCKADTNIEVSKEVVENLTEKIILNEMSMKVVCTDNNQDNNETQDDPKDTMESDSKCSETVIPPIEKIAINVEIENKLALKKTTEIVDDKSNLEENIEILSMHISKASEESASPLGQKQIDEAVFVKHVELEADDKSYLDDSGSKEILSMDILTSPEKNVGLLDQKKASEAALLKHVEQAGEICTTKTVEEQNELPPVDPLAEVNPEPKSMNVFDDLLDKETKLESIPITKSFQKPVSTRKRKISERKSISESDSDAGTHFVTDSISNEKSSDEESVATKKPRIRNKITATRNTRATRQSARVSEEAKSSPELKAKEQIKPEIEEKTLQNLKFDYDENEDIASKMAAIKTLICKETPKKADDESLIDSNESSADESLNQKPIRKGRKSKRGRTGKKNDAQESSSDDSKSAKLPDSKRSKTSESEETTAEKQSRKKRDSAGKGLLKYIDTSLVIETVETEAPIRQSRRIAQQKIREETERRQMEEKMLKQMKAEAEKKKKMASISGPPDEEEDNDRSSDESYKDSTKKKKTKIKPSDKQWQTSSSHSENSESEDEFERPQSEDPGSPLFRSDHEFSPESDDDETPEQPLKRARTAKKQVEESSGDEDVNPNHACQACHKTDCPEWILLCDECDHGYHCSCLKPIIFCIPSGNWYCPLCCHKKLVDDLSLQLEKLDTLIVNIKAEEIRQQKQLEIKKLAEITQENILNDKRKKRSENKAKEDQSRGSKSRRESSNDGSESNDDESSENSSDNEPLNEIFYKLRRRNQATPSYRFNDYDDLINSAIKRDMDEVKGLGNAGRGKDISTIIEADKEEKKLQKMEHEKETDVKDENQSEHQEGEESSGSDIIRPKKAMQRKKKNRKLNNLDATSEEDQASDEDFKGTPSTNSDTEEEYSISSNDVSESSLDLPLKKGKAGKRRTRSAAKHRRYDQNFIDDNTSDEEPLIKKRVRKQRESDEEEFDANEENSDGSTPEDIDSEDLCDDTESDDSSENNWPKKKKKRNASYDIKKPRKHPKKTDGGKDKAFRAGISKKKILKVSENESEASENESDKGRRRTRGKKLLYLIEDDYESDDGIKPGIGVVRPETPPEERELFVKKQEEIKRMLAEKNTEAARQLAVPTIEPIKFALEKPESPIPPQLTSDELASLSTIPKNVIEGAKALDMDYNKIKPIHFGVHSKTSDHPSAHDMSEEDLARMMEEEDFAQHQLKMVGETINRNKLLELEVKEEAFANIGKSGKIKEEKEPEKLAHPETKKRARKPKQDKQAGELSSPPAKMMQTEAALQKGPVNQHFAQLNVPVSLPLTHEPTKPHTQNIPSVPPLISNPISHSPYPTMPPRYQGPHHLNIQDRPSVLSNYMPRHEGMPPRLEGMRPRLEGIPPRLGMQPRFEGMLSRLEGMGPRMQGMPPRLEGMGSRLEGLPPRLEGITARLEGMAARLEVGSPQQHLRFPHQPPEGFSLKSPPIAPQHNASTNEEGEEKKKGRRKKYTPLRTDLIDSNASKVAKLETPTTSSVIHSTLNLSTERPDDKSKASLPPLQRVKPEIFNPATNPPSSVITRLLQPQQRPSFGGFVEQMNVSVTSANNPNAPTNPRAFPEELKHHPIAKQVRPGQQSQFPENPFVPRGMHTLYRGPPTTQPSIYGIPSHHARIPYPFHLHPNNNLRPNMQEYGAPYNIPPQFGYYAPPAHSRQHPSNPAAPPLSHQEHPDLPPNNARPSNNNINPNDEPSESSEFGGLVSYFSSQQELD
ncbi:hypothetical protein ACKWTF_001660 [Chironomus riparius]